MAENDWNDLRRAADTVASLLTTRHETVAVAESSAGGLIAAALLAVPGASAYFRGGAVVYTADAKSILLGKTREVITEPRAATEAHALILAEAIRDRLSTTWGIGETGATGPTGNRYGDPPGHACLAVAGPSGQSRTATLSTASSARESNMFAFATAALRLLAEALAS